MQRKRKNERGSVMVEAIAVVALLGLMGTLLYRQVKNRNEELDNINMASEIRMIKDATSAYLQADQAALSADCNDIHQKMLSDSEKWDINTFLPYNWQKDYDAASPSVGIIDYFDIWLTCTEIDDELTPGRNAISATIIPQADSLPPRLTLKRAARIANLVGSDGGIYITGTPSTANISGTMGAWQVPCSDLGNACSHFDSENNDLEEAKRAKAIFVATTAMDIYVPESNTPDNTVLMPKKVAFNELHSTGYFSVGDIDANSDYNCVRNYDSTNSRFTHEVATAAGTYAQDDTIARVGEEVRTSNCDPLFWVGKTEASNTADNSTDGHVYVKKNLYIGRDNANSNQSVGIETDSENNAKRQISVYDATGKERLTLNAKGQVVARKEGTAGAASIGYRLDSENGDIVLFKEYEIDDHIVQIPTLRLAGTKMESATQADYTDEDGEHTAAYAVDPADTSVMNDIRLISRGGAKLSEILPNYIAKGIESYTENGDGLKDGGVGHTISKPSCPKGYARAITVTPILANQAVSKLKLDGLTGSLTGKGTLDGIKVSLDDVVVKLDTVSAETKSGQDLKPATDDDSLILTQNGPINITINGNETTSDNWTVKLKYKENNPSDDDPITALIHTYCVYDEENFDGDDDVSSDITSPDALNQEVGTKTKNGTRACNPTAVPTGCDSTEVCLDNKCVKRPTCTEETGTKIGASLYCIDGKQVYLECFTNADCHGKTCNADNQCVDPDDS